LVHIHFPRERCGLGTRLAVHAHDIGKKKGKKRTTTTKQNKQEMKELG